MVVRLPFPLVTWNRVLAMGPWLRKRLRHSIHELVSTFIPEGRDSLTQTEYRRRQQLTESSIAAYLKMIRPSTSKKSATHKKRSRRVRKKKPLST